MTDCVTRGAIYCGIVPFSRAVQNESDNRLRTDDGNPLNCAMIIMLLQLKPAALIIGNNQINM